MACTTPLCPTTVSLPPALYLCPAHVPSPYALAVPSPYALAVPSPSALLCPLSLPSFSVLVPIPFFCPFLFPFISHNLRILPSSSAPYLFPNYLLCT